MDIERHLIGKIKKKQSKYETLRAIFPIILGALKMPFLATHTLCMYGSKDRVMSQVQFSS